DDARAFMSATTRKYDLIIFALTDSLVKVSPMAQLRLENYIFTVESIRTALHLLQEDGNLIFYNSYRLPWITRKLELMIHAVMGVYPVTLSRRNSDFAVIIADPRNAEQEAPVGDTDVSIPTDDWSFWLCSCLSCWPISWPAGWRGHGCCMRQECYSRACVCCNSSILLPTYWLSSRSPCGSCWPPS